MIAIAFRRALSKFVVSWRGLGNLQGLTDRGWQGKRPAVGPAVGGWMDWAICCQRNCSCHRFCKLPERNQSRLRHLSAARGSFAP